MANKQDIDLDSLDIDEMVMETVACQVLGRLLAGYGGILTGREKHDRRLVYQLLRAGKTLNPGLPVTAATTQKPRDNVKKYTPSQAIEWFAENYNRQAQPLLQRLEEREDITESALRYGLRKGQQIEDAYMMEVLERVTDLTRGQARALYERVIRPQLRRQEKEQGLVLATMDK